MRGRLAAVTLWPLAILAELFHPEAPPPPEEFDLLDLRCNWEHFRKLVESGEAGARLRAARAQLLAALPEVQDTCQPTVQAHSGILVPPPIDEHLHVIHYVCEPFAWARDENRTPRVFAVALRSCLTDDCVLLAAHLVAANLGRFPPASPTTPSRWRPKC